MAAMTPRYCCFYYRQALRLGWLRTQKGNQYEVSLTDGEAVRQRPGALLYTWPGDECTEDLQAPLEQLRRRGENLKFPQEKLDALYAALPPGESRTMAELEALALPPEAGGWQRAELFLALLKDSRRFRHVRGVFSARSPEDIAGQEAKRAERELREEQQRQITQWRDQLEQGEWTGQPHPQAEDFLEQLRTLLALERRSPHWAELARPLEISSLTTAELEARLVRWLKTAHAWKGWPSLWIRGSEVTPDFAPPLRAAADTLAQQSASSRGRRDFRGVFTCTIDSAATLDRDDAVSILEAGQKELLVALHIAEPSTDLSPGQPLFDEAARRYTSVYTLEGVFPMFPEALSNRRFSLIEAQDRETLSCLVRLGEQGAELVGFERGLIQVTHNLDYIQGQTLVETEAAWGRLSQQCDALAGARERRGAVLQERRDWHLDISDPEHIALVEVNRTGSVHRMVEELAVLHNCLVGSHLKRHRIPGIYRIQPRASGGGSEWVEEGAPVQAARFSVHGAEHRGVGCERYALSTSPIRRFVDLVNQRQIAAHCSGGTLPPLPQDMLPEWAEQAESRTNSANELGRRIQGYWKRRYLAQHLGMELDATVRIRGDGLARRVMLEPLLVEADCELPAHLGKGDAVRVQVVAVLPDLHQVRVRLVGPS